MERLTSRLLSLHPAAFVAVILLGAAAFFGVAVLYFFESSSGEPAERLEHARLVTAAAGAVVCFATLCSDIFSVRPQSARERLIVSLLGFIGALPLTGTTPSSGFYDTAAPIIPVLLLTLLVERRVMLVDEHAGPVDRTVAVFAVLALALGEAAALLAAAEPSAERWMLGVVAGALVAGFVAVVEMAFGRGEDSSRPANHD